MMRNAIPTTETPVTKNSSNIFIFSESNYKIVKRRTVCIRCSKCVSACPVILYPILIFEAMKKGDMERSKRLYRDDFFRCGICSYVCPTGTPLAETICGARK